MAASTITITTGTPPATPAAGSARIYAKANKKLYLKDDTGTETDLTAASASISQLTGDVTATGPGSVPATVNSVGGETAASVAQSVQDTQAATDLDVSNTIVKRDASGDFAAGTITADLAGTATNALTSVFFSGTLLGEVTGNQSSTSIANTVVTAKTLTGYSNLSPIPLSATDTILQALGKLQGQLFSVSDEISLSQNLELKTNRQKVMGSLETSSDILLEGTATLILV